MAIKNLREKEMERPFEEMKTQERWLIPEKEYATIADEIDSLIRENKNGYRNNSNNCDFSKGRKGDILLVHDTKWWQPGAIYGYFCHSGMIINTHGSWEANHGRFAIAAYSDRGIRWDNETHWHNYNYCMIVRVNTWPRSTSLRRGAANYVSSQLGKHYQIPLPYNKWNTSAWYCSQLDWGGYWHRSPWYAKVDIDGIPDRIDFGTVSPDAIVDSWRTYKITGSW